MKKTFLVFITIISLGCSAQVMPHAPGSYTTNAFLDKFVGNWVWTSGTDTMQITLEKQRIHFPAPLNYDVDEIVGWHRYVKNGAVVESSLQYAGTLFDSGHATLIGASLGKFLVRFTTFKDISKNKLSDQCYFSYQGGTPVQALWSLANSEGLKTGTFDFEFTVPKALTFTKL